MNVKLGADELLRGEAEDWAGLVRTDGGVIELFIDPAGQHCGMFMPTSEGKAIRQSMAAFLRRHLRELSA